VDGWVIRVLITGAESPGLTYNLCNEIFSRTLSFHPKGTGYLALFTDEEMECNISITPLPVVVGSSLTATSPHYRWLGEQHVYLS